MSWDAELTIAMKAARAAGDRLRDLSFEPKKILSAEGRDIKIQADRDAEKIILDVLAETGLPALAEESGEHGTIEDDGCYWVVDPLDGTMNYARGIPMNCVSIALCKGENPVLGVIHDFNRDECFSGVVGETAHMNEMSVSVSSVRNRGDAILSTGFPVGRGLNSGSLEEFIAGSQEFKKVRMLGSAALSLAYVACGRVDAYAEDEIMLWDVAAGLALVTAAGGHVKVTKSERSPWGRRVRCASCKELFGSDDA